MQTCIQGILTGEDDAIAFVKALTADYKNVLCLKDISDERYERRYNHKNQHSDYNKLIKLLF